MQTPERCFHVFYRTSYSERICGFCNLRQKLEIKQEWVEDGVIGHKLVHLMKEDGTLVYDECCDKCKMEILQRR